MGWMGAEIPAGFYGLAGMWAPAEGSAVRTACLVGAIMQANRVFDAANCVRGAGHGGRAAYVPWYASGEENFHSPLSFQLFTRI